MLNMGKMGKTGKPNENKKQKKVLPKMGRIGKPQKSKKHKKMLPFDPSIEGDRKSFRQDHTANRPPKNEEDQEIPRKVQFYMDRKGTFSKKRPSRKERIKDKGKNKSEQLMEKGMTKLMRPAPKFVQHQAESNTKFLERMDMEAQSAILKAKLSEKYKIDFDELEVGNGMKKKKSVNKAKQERLKEKKAHKKEKKMERKSRKQGDFSYLKDKVEFGEVAMAPPSLTAKPRKAAGSEDSVPRPGRKALLLKKIMPGIEASSSGTSVFSSQRGVGQTLKRKQMSMSQQSIMDKERNKAIDLYRQLKGRQNISLPS